MRFLTGGTEMKKSGWLLLLFAGAVVSCGPCAAMTAEDITNELLGGVMDMAGREAFLSASGTGAASARQAGLMPEQRQRRQNRSTYTPFAQSVQRAVKTGRSNRAWVTPFATRQEMDEKAEYSAYKYEAIGGSAGYDHAFGSFYAGLALTWSQGDFDTAEFDDDNTLDNYGISLYGQYYGALSGIFTTLSGGYMFGESDLRVVTPAGILANKNETDSYWFSANAGKDFFFGERWTLTPSAGVFLSVSEGGGHTSTLGGAVFQNFDEISADSLLTPFDLEVEYRLPLGGKGSLSLALRGGYVHDWRDDSRAEGSFSYAGSTATVFMRGAEPERSGWNAGAGVTYSRGSLDIGVGYRYDRLSGFESHRASATVGWNF
jgi:outer membrane autotransporter protein